ncbi:hypothetical protein Q9251_12505 [Alkalihalobacillus macyae]|uniref:hypothetical protein n=1 Tax=Guptibacillus hwajinpoensis TaxID=208199 RepID=UPI00273ACA12|nr:hypothetical protein [Alkalihalobacillus macyae]MDP4551692.1 hypothetical protein [Alkalihalobacillus macyae]
MITIGKISVPDQFVWAGIGIIAAISIIYFLEKKWYNRSTASSIAYETVIFFVLVWKVSLLFINPTLVLSAPLSLLYFTGGTYGFVIALFLSIGYVGWKLVKNEGKRRILFQFGIAIEIASVIIGGLSILYSDGSFLFMLLHVLLLGLLVVTKSSQWLFLDLLLWGGILSIILEFYTGKPVILGLSDWQLINLLTAGCAAFILLHLHTRRSSE